MRLRSSLVPAFLVVAFALAAHADTISTFSPTDAIVSNGAVISGDVIIDTTLGEVTSVDLFYSLGTTSYEFNQGLFQGTFSGRYDITAFDSSYMEVIFLSLTSPSIVGYAGGDLCVFSFVSDTGNCQINATSYDSSEVTLPTTTLSLISGSLTEVSTTTTGVTPEPASIALLGTGLLGAFGVIRRRIAP